MPKVAPKLKVYVCIDFETVAVTAASSKEAAPQALRKLLSARRRKELEGVSLQSRTGLVYWSEEKQKLWYRFPGDLGPCLLHPKRLTAALRKLVSTREPGPGVWIEATSASQAP